MASNGCDIPAPQGGSHPLREIPLIGISTYLEQAKFGLWDMPSAVLMKSYLDSVVAAGGMPVMLPPVGRWLAEHVSRLDGLVIAGGADIDPSRYGQAPHQATGKLRLDRDAAEFGLFHLALEADLPVLGVCRGLQLINIALGGTLHQHVPDVCGTEKHNPRPGVFGSSEVRLAPGSVVGGLLGDHVTVHCHHHQAIDQLGSGLTAVGWSQDGITEAIELPEAGFVLGVQWHPEAQSTDVRLFEGLVDAAHRKIGQRTTSRRTMP